MYDDDEFTDELKKDNPLGALALLGVLVLILVMLGKCALGC
jgi:hypothetical protein